VDMLVAVDTLVALVALVEIINSQYIDRQLTSMAAVAAVRIISRVADAIVVHDHRIVQQDRQDHREITAKMAHPVIMVLLVHPVKRRVVVGRRAQVAHVSSVRLVHPVRKVRMVRPVIQDRAAIRVCPEIPVAMVHPVFRDRPAMLDRMQMMVHRDRMVPQVKMAFVEGKDLVREVHPVPLEIPVMPADPVRTAFPAVAAADPVHPVAPVRPDNTDKTEHPASLVNREIPAVMLNTARVRIDQPSWLRSERRAFDYFDQQENYINMIVLFAVVLKQITT